MPSWVEVIALLKLVFGLLLPAGLTLERIVVAESCSKEWFSYWFLHSFVSYFLPFGLFSVNYVPVVSEAEVCLFAWLFLPQCNGYEKLCGKWRNVVGVTEYLNTTEATRERNSPSSRVRQLAEEINAVLRAKEEEVHQAQISGNIFETRVKEKRLDKAMTRVQSLITKLKKDDETDEATTVSRGITPYKQQTKSNFQSLFERSSHRQSLIHHVIPE